MVSGYLIKNNGKIDMLKMQQAIFIFVFVFTFALSFLKQLKQKENESIRVKFEKRRLQL